MNSAKSTMGLLIVGLQLVVYT
ncbi:unnamed protein product [Lathyrus oleraceus]